MKKKTEVQLKTALKYVLYFLCMALLFNAETKNGLRPFALGFFVALVYSRENLLILSPLYILASLVADVSWQGAVVALSPCVVLAAAYFAHAKLKKPMTMVAINVYTLLAQVPYVLLNVGSATAGIDAAVTVLVAQIFAYSAIIVVYAVKIRGLKYRFTLDELIGGQIFVAVFALAFFNITIFSFVPFYGIAAFVILACTYVFGGGIPLAAAVLFGAGAAFASGDIALIAVFSLWAIAAVSLKSTSIYLSATAILAMDMLCGYYFGAYSAYTYWNVLSVCFGVLSFLALPKRAKQFLSSFSTTIKNGNSTRTIVNRSRKDIASRLGFLSNVFADISDILADEVKTEASLDNETYRLAREISYKVCGRCGNYEHCYGALGRDTAAVLEPIVEAAVESGKATMLNMPPFITSRCKKIPELIAVINRGVQGMDGFKSARAGVESGKLMLAEQMGGVSDLLDELAFDIKRRLNFDSSLEKQIIDEFAYRNIVVDEAAVYGDDDLNVTLLVREADKDKESIPSLLSKIAGREMLFESEGEKVGGWHTLNFRSAPYYEIIFGKAQERKSGEEVSGDIMFTGRVKDVVMLAISDGMGSGREALKASAATMDLIENFYRAGFHNDVILALTNRLLSMRSSENFSTLDMLTIDLRSARADIVKLGASDGFLLRGGTIQTLESRELPIGVLDKMAPSIENIKLESGDIAVLVSDGISDTLGTDGLVHILSETSTKNPQTLADYILERAKEVGVRDDASVICCRLV